MNPLKSSPENNYLEDESSVAPGLYHVKAEFKDRFGENRLALLGEVETYEKQTFGDLKKLAKSKAVSLGLHNQGMDTNFKRFPNGQPVIIFMKHETTGEELTFEQKFDGNGYAVE